MAQIWYGHFDSTPEDRRVLLAEDWAKYMRCFLTDGIRNGGTCLQITQDTGMAVRMDTGTANVQGYIFDSTEDTGGRYFRILVPAAHNLHPRIDRVVLRLDRTIQNRNIEPQILLGTASANPVPTPLTRNENIWELSLAQIRIEAGSINIPANKITDERFQTSLCGLMHSVLGLDSSVWQGQFDAFMADVRTAFGRDWETIIGQHYQDYADWMAAEQAELERLRLEVQNHVLAMETQSFALINNNFDDWSTKRGCKYTTSFLEGKIVGTITVVSSGMTLAEKITEFPAGAIKTTITFYPWENTEGTNTIKTAAYTVTKTVTFPSGTIEGVIL